MPKVAEGRTGADTPAMLHQAMGTAIVTKIIGTADNSPPYGDGEAHGEKEQLGAAAGDGLAASSTNNPPQPLNDVIGLKEVLDNDEASKRVYTVEYDEFGLPATLLDWRRQPQDDHRTARCVGMVCPSYLGCPAAHNSLT